MPDTFIIPGILHTALSFAYPEERQALAKTSDTVESHNATDPGSHTAIFAVEKIEEQIAGFLMPRHTPDNTLPRIQFIVDP